MPRYYLAFPIPKRTDQQLRTWYQSRFPSPLPVKDLHSTVIPPFFLRTDHTKYHLNNVLQHTATEPITAKFGTPSTFTQLDKKILYLPLTPTKPFQQLHQQLLINITPHITFDLSVYNQNKLPLFLPHVTLNYDFTDPLDNISPSNISFTTPPLEILVAR